MKNSLITFVIFSLILLATGCSSKDNINSGSKIVSPTNNTLPITGTWQIQSYKLPEENSTLKPEADKWINTLAIFSNFEANIGHDSCKNPNFKIKVVNADSYFLYSYKQKADFLNITEKEVQIVTITSENNFFHEFIKVNNQLMLTNIDGIFMYLTKVSNDKTIATIGNFSGAPGTNLKPIDPNSAAARSVVLIGLRSSKKSSTSLGYLDKDFSYRTLLVSYTDKKLNSILQTDSLFVPRMTGFWGVNVERCLKSDHSVDYLSAFPYGTQQKNNLPLNFTNNERKIIDFIGNDYISIERIIQKDSSSNLASNFSNTLQVLPLDNLNSKESIKLTELCDASALTALQEGAASYLNSANNNTLFAKNISESNWGVFRRNGHWVLKGRLSPLSNTPIDISPDFYIPLAAPKKTLIGYDDLSLTWSSIKERVPDAIDAFTSPSKDIVITISNTIMSIYKLENNNISLSPLAQIKFKEKENETLIMDQWAQGDYTDTWTKAFNKNITSIPTMVKID